MAILVKYCWTPLCFTVRSVKCALNQTWGIQRCSYDSFLEMHLCNDLGDAHHTSKQELRDVPLCFPFEFQELQLEVSHGKK